MNNEPNLTIHTAALPGFVFYAKAGDFEVQIIPA